MTSAPDTGSTGDHHLDGIVRSVLRVARLGEVDHFGWWGTRSFGAAGRVVLKQRLPRTWRMAAIELDMAAASNRHNELIDRRNAVHLFSDNWPVRRWASAWVSEQKTSFTPDILFEELETATVEEVVVALGGGRYESVSGQAVRIGSVDRAALGSPALLEPKVSELAAIYAEIGAGLAVPYMELEG